MQQEQFSQSIGFRRRQTSCFIYFENFLPSWTKLRDLRQGTLAIIQALEEWWHYIQGSPHTTVVLSDHKNLTYYWEAKKLNRRQARWSLYLSEYDVKLVHTPENKMIQSDALSRRPDLCPENDNDNEDIIMLPDDLFLNLIDLELQKKIAPHFVYLENLFSRRTKLRNLW